MSGLGLFVKGLNEGLPVGIDLAQEFDRQGDVRATQKAGDLLAQMNALDPFAATDDAAQQGLAEPGQQPQTNPNRGFSGDEFKSLSDQYFDAISGMSDIKQWGMARQAFGEMRMEKINNYLDAGLQAYDQGDTATATRMLRGASAFMNPGITPEVAVDPNTGAFIVANYDKDDNPVGGFAMTRDQLMDIRGRNTDFNAWASRDARKQEHKEQMGLQWARFNASQKRANAASAASGSRTAMLNAKDAAGIAKTEEETRGLRLTNDLSERTLDSAVAGVINTNFFDAQQARADVAKTEAETTGLEQTNEQKAITAESDANKQIAANEEAIAKSELAEQQAGDAEYDAWEDGASAAFNNLTQYKIPPPDTDNTPDQDLDFAAGTVKPGDKETIPDLWLYEKNSSGGYVPRPEILEVITPMYEDLWKNNPDIAEETAAAVIEGTVGRSQRTDYDMSPEGQWYAYTDAGRYKVSKQVAENALKFKTDNYDQLLAMQTSEEGRARVIEQASGLAMGTPFADEEPAGAEGIPEQPDMGRPVLSEPTPNMPVPPDMASAPGAAAFPGGIPSDPRAPQNDPAAIAAYRAQADQLGPPTITPPAIDDTASGIQTMTMDAQAQKYGPVTGQIPELSQAITAWIQENMPADSPAVREINAILRQMDPVTRTKALDEINALRGQ